MAELTSVGNQFPFRPKQFQEFALPVENFVAQMEEVKLGLLPILSGQARYVVDLARAIQKTVPKPGSITENRQNLLAQSTRNMMSLVFGIENGFLNAENLIAQGIDPNSEVTNPDQAQFLLDAVELTPKQEDAIEEAIDLVLKTPAIRKGKKSKSLKESSSQEGDSRKKQALEILKQRGEI